MGTLDASIVNVALPRLSRELQATPQSTVWVTTAFLLTCACAIPATAALGDRIGRRRLYLIGVPIFTLASLGCALAPSLAWLVGFRVFQALGASMNMAVSLPILRLLFRPARLGSILGINAMVVAIGSCAGPSLGGLILAHLSWPWLFLINLPIGVLTFCLAAIALPKDQAISQNYDWPGAMIIAAGVAAFLLGLHQLADPATMLQAAVLLVICVVLVIAFLRRERRATRPVIPLSLWRNSVFTLSVVTAFWSFFGQGVAVVALPFVFQSAHGVSPLESAIMFTPWPAAIVIVAPIAGRLADRFRAAHIAIIGLVVYIAGLLSITLLGDHPSQIIVLCSTALAGIGFGLFQSPNNREMQSNVPIIHASSGAAILTLNRNVAQSVGAGAVSMALVISGAVFGSVVEEARAATMVLWVAVAGAVFALVFSLAKLRAPARN